MSDDDGHSITSAQAAPEAVSLRRAAAALKEQIRQVDRRIAVAALLVPVLLVGLKLAVTAATPVAVFYAIGLLLAFALGLDRARARWLRAAARAREEHDCRVLDLPWSRRAAGEEPGPDDAATHQAASAGLKKPPVNGGDPFPREVDHLPLPLARIVCQGLAVYWEPDAVHRYLGRLWVAVPGGIALLVVVGLMVRPGTEPAMTTLIATAPMALWVWREHRQWRRAEAQATRVAERARSAWHNAMNRTIQTAALPSLARSIQDDIFRFRVDQPVIPRWAVTRYWQRSSFDARKVDQFVEEYQEHFTEG